MSSNENVFRIHFFFACLNLLKTILDERTHKQIQKLGEKNVMRGKNRTILFHLRNDLKCKKIQILKKKDFL